MFVIKLYTTVQVVKVIFFHGCKDHFRIKMYLNVDSELSVHQRGQVDTRVR